jgi:predicted anti-sigma-YlaC factor YlaD
MTNGQRTECGEIERIVWTDGPDAALESHIHECASCREEVRRAGDMQAALRGMQMRLATPPEGLEAAIIAAVNKSRLDKARDIVSHPKFWRGAAVGAAAATAAVGLLVASRRRREPEELVA